MAGLSGGAGVQGGEYAQSGSPKAMTTLIANYLEQRLESMTDILNQILISSL